MMTEIVKRITYAALLLMIIPGLLWVSGWQWQPGNISIIDKLLYAVTETVTRPWGVLTAAILIAWVLSRVGTSRRMVCQLAGIIIVTLLIAQGLNTAIKQHEKEARPYVMWLQQHQDFQAQAFYAQPGTQRTLEVQKATAQSALPGWLQRHWAFETGYSFPSGHSTFAAVWALLAVVLLWPGRHLISLLIIWAWALSVMVSRMILGMHWPRDVIGSICLSWLLVIVAAWCINRYCYSFRAGDSRRR